MPVPPPVALVVPIAPPAPVPAVVTAAPVLLAPTVVPTELVVVGPPTVLVSVLVAPVLEVPLEVFAAVLGLAGCSSPHPRCRTESKVRLVNDVSFIANPR